MAGLIKMAERNDSREDCVIDRNLDDHAVNNLAVAGQNLRHSLLFVHWSTLVARPGDSNQRLAPAGTACFVLQNTAPASTRRVIRAM